MNVTEAIASIEAAIPHPEEGLPEDVFLFVSRINPLINVDLLIQDDAGRTLLTWRSDRHYGPGWHVPGGIIRYKEQIQDRIRTTAESELGAPVDWDPAPLLIAQTIGGQRERGHFISLLYRCRLLAQPKPELRAVGDPPEPGEWLWHDRCPENLIPEQRQYAPFLAGNPTS